MYQRPSGPSTSVPCPFDHQRSSAESARAIGLWGEFSQGPWIDFERAETIMCPVGGPAVPPSARIMWKYSPCFRIFGPSCEKLSTIQSSGYFQPS